MARIRKLQKWQNCGLQKQHFLKLLGVLALCISSRDHFCVAFSSSTLGKRRYGFTAIKFSLPSPGVVPSLLSPGMSRRRGLSGTRRRTGKSALKMVLTTPIDIIEQASTVNLLDDLIDESVRTSARRPIIRQFDPSSGWVSSIKWEQNFIFVLGVAKQVILFCSSGDVGGVLFSQRHGFLVSAICYMQRLSICCTNPIRTSLITISADSTRCGVSSCRSLLSLLLSL